MATKVGTAGRITEHPPANTSSPSPPIAPSPQFPISISDRTLKIHPIVCQEKESCYCHPMFWPQDVTWIRLSNIECPAGLRTPRKTLDEIHWQTVAATWFMIHKNKDLQLALSRLRSHCPSSWVSLSPPDQSRLGGMGGQTAAPPPSSPWLCMLHTSKTKANSSTPPVRSHQLTAFKKPSHPSANQLIIPTIGN